MTRYERRRKEARNGNASLTVREYAKEIEAQKTRLRNTKNGFQRTCCRQEIESLTAEMNKIEAEFIG